MDEIPIALFGGAVVFLAGAGFSFWMLDQYNKMGVSNPVLFSDSKPAQNPNSLTTSKVTWLSVIGGGLSTAIFEFLLFGLSRTLSLQILLGLIALVFLLCLIWLLANRPATGGQTKSKKTHPTIRKYEDCSAYRELLARARQDKALASRLIEYERTRTPNASTSQLCGNAIYRLERDNR